jgi:CubicO group peptidase (beta-lactamase class C family)
MAALVVENAEIRRMLVQRVDEQKQADGLVVGVIEPGGRRVVSHGGVDGDTVFEIGSFTKVFTSLLLADMVQRGEVKLDDSVAKYLPEGVTVPQRGGRAITLKDLATHTSGLPRLPSNLLPKNPMNPYADYTAEQMYQFLSTHELRRDIGSKYEYSNLGVGLLGHALARRAGMDYEALLRARVTGPLGMKNTAITLTPWMKEHLAAGHNAAGQPAANWDIPTLAGAGAVRSTANDMLIFLAAAMGYVKTPLAPAFAAMLVPRMPTGSPVMEIALGWHILTKDGEEQIWHNGGTGGYRSWAGYNPKSRTGVVVLSNRSTTAGVDDIGRHLLNPAYDLVAPPKAAQ